MGVKTFLPVADSQLGVAREPAQPGGPNGDSLAGGGGGELGGGGGGGGGRYVAS